MSTRRWRKSHSGQGLVEYSLILMLVALSVVGTLALIGPGLVNFFTRVSNSFPT